MEARGPLAPGTQLAGRPARGAGLAGPGSRAVKAPRHGRVMTHMRTVT